MATPSVIGGDETARSLQREWEQYNCQNNYTTPLFLTMSKLLTSLREATFLQNLMNQLTVLIRFFSRNTTWICIEMKHYEA